MNRRLAPTRRSFLRSLGVSAAALPFIGGLSSLARGQSAARKRFITVYTPNGMRYDDWRPRNVKAALDAPYAETLLSDAAFQWSPILEPLAPMANKINILDRLTIGAARHTGEPGYPETGTIGHQRGMAALLTGMPIDPSTGAAVHDVGNPGLGAAQSLDQRLAATIPETAFGSLELGWRVDKNYNDRHVNKAIAYAGPNQPLYPVDDPIAAFDRIFAGVTSGDTPVDPVLAATRARRASMLDHVKTDLARLTPRLSGADRELLQFHTDATREVEQRITQLSTVSCDPVRPMVLDNSLENAPLVAEIMVDLAALAIGCDQTRIMTFMFAYSETDQTYPWVEVNDSHHGMSHDQAAGLVPVDAWYASQYLRLLQKLDAVPDEEGTVLDNSVVWWANCLSNGQAHHQINMPFVLAGGLGGYFKTGRYLHYRRPELDETENPWNWNSGHRDSDPSNNDLLVSIAQGMGLDVNEIGLPQVNHGPLPGLTA